MQECKLCKNEKKELETIPYIVHESEMVRNEMREKRILGVMLALAAAFVISNAVWIFALVK
jgi:hypothetical protein